jgi:hypothetical protein
LLLVIYSFILDQFHQVKLCAGRVISVYFFMIRRILVWMLMGLWILFFRRLALALGSRIGVTFENYFVKGLSHKSQIVFFNLYFMPTQEF